MKIRLLISLILFITILSLNASAQAKWVKRVTKNSYEDSFPQIKGNYLVWQGYVDGDWEIFLYNVKTKHIYQITDNDYNDISPQTDGNYVVWLGFSHTGGEIFLYDIASGEPPTQITQDDNVDSPPQIANGRIVWTSHPVSRTPEGVIASVEPGEIFLYHVATELTEQLTVNTSDDSSPRIDNESVVWVQADDQGNTTLYIYNLNSPISPNTNPAPAPEFFVWKDSPQTDGYLTVSARHDGEDREIFVYNTSLHTYQQITDNDLEDRYPRISGNNIAWVEGEDQDSEIFLISKIKVRVPKYMRKWFKRYRKVGARRRRILAPSSPTHTWCVRPGLP